MPYQAVSIAKPGSGVMARFGDDEAVSHTTTAQVDRSTSHFGSRVDDCAFAGNSGCLGN